MSKPYHIIIADDDIDDQIIIKSALSGIGKHVEVTSVYNGFELLTTLKNHNTQPDVIILDINMPVMDGLEALIKIKQDEQLKNIPVYILSTMRSREKFEDSKGKGAARCFSKPVTFAAYRSLICSIIDEVP
jgi:CheY-like chemotaxis protein